MSAIKYEVFFEQINRHMVEVTAKDEYEALEKANRKWKRECSGVPRARVEKAGAQ